MGGKEIQRVGNRFLAGAVKSIPAPHRKVVVSGNVPEEQNFGLRWVINTIPPGKHPWDFQTVAEDREEPDPVL